VLKLTHINASSRTLPMIVHKLIDGSSASGQIMLQTHQWKAVWRAHCRKFTAEKLTL